MNIPNKSHQNYESDSIKNTHTDLKIRLVDPAVVIDPVPLNGFRREDPSLYCDRENEFFKGLLLMLPCSILLWIIVVWGVRSLIY